MYGMMNKPGRGGIGQGRGIKRSLPPPSPSSAPLRAGGMSGPANRPSLGSSGPSPARLGIGTSPNEGNEEDFKMVSEDGLDFGAIIRLTPDLVDEIRRVEALGGAARIKFDANSNNLAGNVIEVGGKEFKFTWSRELGVCDIYQELQNGEYGNGLLSECGTAWRKLNVQRILDESLKNHVKMRSEEAERRLKSRKSIVLDPANPSVKNQAKTLAAAALEGNMRKMHWKKDQFKKRKLDTVGSTIPSKPLFKSGTPAHVSSGCLPSTSPQQLPVEQTGVKASLPSIGIGNPPRAHAVVSEEQASLPLKEDNIKSERELQNRPASVSVPRKLPPSKLPSSSHPSDLRSLLISVLMANPKGMSLKALEKAVGESIPGAGKKIEGIIKSIATYQAPGRYLLKSGINLDISKEPQSQSASPDAIPEQKSLSTERESAIDEVLSNLDESDSKKIDIENIDIEKISPETLVAGVEVPNDKEDGACSSSESSTDSDSDSSDSGSDSQSQCKSKSRSPASSNESDSGDSSSSKEGSDVDVDIMDSDEEKDETGHKVTVNEEHLSVEKLHPSDYHDHLMGIDSLVEDERKSKDGSIKYSTNKIDNNSGPSTSSRKMSISEDVDKKTKDSKMGSDSRNSREGVVSGKKPWSVGSSGQQTFRKTNITPDRKESSIQAKGQPRSVSNDGSVNEITFESRTDKQSQESTAMDLDPRMPAQIVGNSVGRAKHIEVTGKSRKPSEKKKTFVRPETNAFSPVKDEPSKDIRDVIMDVNNKFFSEKGGPLRRELSELEVGEFREPSFLEQAKGSSLPKHSAPSKESTKRRSLESKKQSPYLSKCLSQPGQEVIGKRMQESDLSISSRLQQRQQIDGPNTDSRHKKSSSRDLMQSDTKENGHLVSKAYADGKFKVGNGLSNSSDRIKESYRVENKTNSTHKVDFSSDEDDSFYAKYDKDEPVLRGPIKDYVQYQDYVQEYREKYKCYSSLHNHLEKYRVEFLKVGQDLESYKNTDKEAYRSISDQIMQMYRQCRKKHSRMKKIFVVLHDELKAIKQRIKDFAAEYPKN